MFRACCGLIVNAPLEAGKDLWIAARYQHLSPTFLAVAVAHWIMFSGFRVTHALPEPIG
jgi:hypothetical protein